MFQERKEGGPQQMLGVAAVPSLDIPFYRPSFEEASRATILAFDAFDSTLFAKSYAHRSYPTHVVPEDTRLLLEFLAEYFPKISGARTLLDLASGPVVSQMCSAAPYTSSIIMSDILDSNLSILQSWQQHRMFDQDFKDWRQYTDFSLRCEGRVGPSLDEICERENEVRRKIQGLMRLDIRQPLSKGFSAPVDAISCFYGTEAAGSCFEEWQMVLANITTTLVPGGHLLLSIVAESDSYLFVDMANCAHRVRIANINELQLHAGLEAAGLPSENRIIRRVNFSGFESEGYDTMFLVYARKPGP